jgi:hypothetical protein
LICTRQGSNLQPYDPKSYSLVRKPAAYGAVSASQVAGFPAAVTLAESDFYLIVQGALRGAHQSQVTEFSMVFVKSA